MKLLLRGLLLLALLRAFPAFSLETEEARHLLLRAGFGATPEEIAALRSLSRVQAVDRLLDGVRTEPVLAPPDGIEEPWPNRKRWREMEQAARKALRKRQRRLGLSLKGWWYREMVATDSPLTERLVLFWHGHFTSSLRKVRQPALIYRQNLLLRRHALGNFGELLHAIARDPAMILYLDNQTNRAGHPNENFARELLELFTLGEGHYGEEDIREAARAFTGWKADRHTLAFRFVRRQHDDGIKHFLGRSGRFDGDDIIDIVLAQPQTARWIAGKLWRLFIVTPPDDKTLEELARRFRKDYELRPLVRAILLSDAFWSPANRGRDIKPPAVLIAGTLRLLQIDPQEVRPLVRAGRMLGQDLFDPPSVKGWPQGESWIDSNSLLARQSLMSRLLQGRRGRGMSPVMHDRLRQLGSRKPAKLANMLLAAPPVDGVPVEQGEEAVTALLLDLSWQLM